VSEHDQNIVTLPVLPLKNSVLFPHLLMPLSVGRPHSLAAVESALTTEDKEILIVAQRDATVDAPQPQDLYTVGTKAVIKKMARPTDVLTELIVMGVERVMIIKVDEVENYMRAQVRTLPVENETTPETEALFRAVVDLATKAIQLSNPQESVDLRRMLAMNDDPLRLVYMLGSMLSLDLPKEQSLLEANTRRDALRLMHAYLGHEVQVLEIRSKIASEAQSEMSKEQREYLLRQQLRAIQQELGDKNPEKAEVDLLREQLDRTQLPPEVRKEAERELTKLERLPSGAPDFHVTRSYLEFLIELPWGKLTDDQLDITRARQILDEDHFDLKDVKARILEQLAVLKLNPEAKAPILCFVGPPGVGKTSLGQSIARALGRKFERLSLGGMHDEAELRGHRRTYIGAMPGRIIQGIRRAGAMNPILMLDEIDKLGRDFRGDPAAALLEILDPEQNKSFRDNYLDQPFDLSRVFFITTANSLDTVPRPLLDRMEVLRLPGYTEEEKIEIAKRYLVPRQVKETGLTAEKLSFEDATLRRIIGGYTREAGLRQLERTIGRVARKVALKFAEGEDQAHAVLPEQLADMLGPEMFNQEQMRKEMSPGVAPGLAWTEAGGEVLYIETTLLPEGSGLTLTGHLGTVMQESAKAAQSYIWAHAKELGIDTSRFKGTGVHIHVPSGAIPKDGPSAGITMAVSLASAYSEMPARGDTAMTGEITLAGLVLPIGGVKEKVLAARRAGMNRVILPKANQKDLPDLPDNVREEMQFVFAERIEEVLQAAIGELPGPQKEGLRKAS
jgi:ATP-dependent Lon protease